MVSQFNIITLPLNVEHSQVQKPKNIHIAMKWFLCFNYDRLACSLHRFEQ